MQSTFRDLNLERLYETYAVRSKHLLVLAYMALLLLACLALLLLDLVQGQVGHLGSVGR